MQTRNRLYRRNCKEKVLQKRTTSLWNEYVHDTSLGHCWLFSRRHKLSDSTEWTPTHEKTFRRKFYVLEGRAGYSWFDKGNSKKSNHKCGDCAGVRNKDSGCDWHYARTVIKHKIARKVAIEELEELGHINVLSHRNRGIQELRCH